MEAAASLYPQQLFYDWRGETHGSGDGPLWDLLSQPNWGLVQRQVWNLFGISKTRAGINWQFLGPYAFLPSGKKKLLEGSGNHLVSSRTCTWFGEQMLWKPGKVLGDIVELLDDTLLALSVLF